MLDPGIAEEFDAVPTLASVTIPQVPKEIPEQDAGPFPRVDEKGWMNLCVSNCSCTETANEEQHIPPVSDIP